MNQFCTNTLWYTVLRWSKSCSSGMENYAFLESTESRGSGEGRPGLGFRGLGTPKPRPRQKKILWTCKILPGMLRNEWGDFGEKGVLCRWGVKPVFLELLLFLHKEVYSLWRFRLHDSLPMPSHKRLLIFVDKLLLCQAFYISYLFIVINPIHRWGNWVSSKVNNLSTLHS